MLDIISNFKENTDSKEPDNLATNLVQCCILELYRILTYFNNNYCSLLDSVFFRQNRKNYLHLQELRCQYILAIIAQYQCYQLSQNNRRTD